MRDFLGITFQGTFRSYQSKILKEVEQYKKDDHIHIVAAPGSGKTILGLELIRQLGHPVLILAPTTTIRQQWGERFEESFLPVGENLEDYFSTRADKPRLLTCLTYQALFSAMSGTEEESNAKIDLPLILKKAGVTTLCLDEAHHLRNEWYRSIIDLKEKSGISFQTIALTATPPYDSNPAEWKKYISLCGEIDAEISAPELVAQKTLCPHQDFVYFSRPTESEFRLIKEYRDRASKALEEIEQRKFLERALEAAAGLPDTDELFYGKPSEARAFLFVAKQEGCNIPKQFRPFLFERSFELRRKRVLAQKKLVPEEMAYQFILDHPDCFNEENVEELRAVLKKNSLMERNKVCLVSNKELKKMLASSMGKLEGIQTIVKNERSVMGESLRMVILTDYIREEFVPKIGSAEAISKMGAVPIFEMLRRAMMEDRTLGVLSGSTVILPDQAKEEARRLAEEEGCSISFTPLSDTGYSRVSFSGGNKEKVTIVTELFRTGFIQILIGTASLLGEGWDSPCINSLIIASFVGSFMLSNQMRGRAIRVDPDRPWKVSTIWHLITPDTSAPYLGEDFVSVSKRFDGFLAPDFIEDKIRSGIDRLGIHPDMKKGDLKHCNQRMLQTSKDREAIRDKWNRCIAQYKNGHMDICQPIDAKVDFIPRSFCYMNVFAIAFITTLVQVLYSEIYNYKIHLAELAFAGTPIRTVICVGLFLAVSFLIIFLGCMEAVRLLSPKKLFHELAESVFLAMKDADLIESEDARVETAADPYGISISCMLKGGNLREKEIYAEAIQEMLSPMNSPRYVILRYSLFGLKGRFSFSCPSILGKNGELAEYLEKRLRQKLGHCRVFYTRTEEGHRLYKKCVKRSFINYRLEFGIFRLYLRRQEVY